MSWQKINWFFPLLGIVLGFTTVLTLTGGCLPADPQRTRILDAQGNVAYEPPLPATQVLPLPPTGRESLDYVIAAMAAGVYGALGYWIRRVKVNGGKELELVHQRIDRLEDGPGPAGSEPGRQLEVEELRRLAKLLEKVSTPLSSSD